MKSQAKMKSIPVFGRGGHVLSDRQILDAKAFLRPDEAAAILRVSRTMVYEMVAVGELTGTKKRPLRISSASVSAALEQLAE